MAIGSFRSFLVCQLVLWAGTVSAQAWPSKPIRWIVPFAPAGANDITARLACERLTRALGQPVVVENRPGAGGTIGIELVARSAPDGYTIVSSSDSITSTPHLYSKIGFHPLRDFIPVTELGRQPVVLAAHRSLGVNSVAELVALARIKPGLAYATSGAGTQQHIAAEWFANLARPTLQVWQGEIARADDTYTLAQPAGRSDFGGIGIQGLCHRTVARRVPARQDAAGDCGAPQC